jgi:hypothetical protein
MYRIADIIESLWTQGYSSSYLVGVHECLPVFSKPHTKHSRPLVVSGKLGIGRIQVHRTTSEDFPTHDQEQKEPNRGFE